MSTKIDWTAFKAFVEDFKSESDRAAVILGAAKLDALLGQMLDRNLLPSLSSTDELLEGDAPLATFSARINACYRLGLVTADFAKALHLIRRIRNSFAHETTTSSLETGPHADRLRSLLLPLKPLPFFIKFRDHFFDKANPSTEFRACLAMMAARLEARLYGLSQIDNGKPWVFIKESWANEETTDEDEPDGAV